MITQQDFDDYILNSITYIDGEKSNNDKIRLFEDYIQDFFFSIYIHKSDINHGLFCDSYYPDIIMDHSNVIQKDFSFEEIFTENTIHANKLIIIEKMTAELLYSEYMRNIFTNNKELNITIIILSFNPLKDKNLLNMVDKILFTKTDDIKKVYFRCFLTYPIYDIFTKKMTELNDDQYLLYMKKMNNYIKCDDRFIIIGTNKMEKKSDETFDDIEDEIITIVI